MKMRLLNRDNTYFPTKEEFQKLQWKKGWVLSVVGLFVYAFLYIIGKRPKEYHGICKYFEIGKSGSGCSMGWFFICGADASEYVKRHEVGHGIFNANIGGLRTLGCSIGSVFRYWYRKIFKITSPSYYSWWFENYASTCGIYYVNSLESKKDS